MIRWAVAFMALAAVVGYSWGFTHILSAAESSPKYGVLAGIGSAVAWAIGSSFGNSFLGYAARPTLNNWFNAFAAVFAALSLGYLSPANSLCQPTLPYLRSMQIQTPLVGRSWALGPLCRLRAVDDSAFSVSDLINATLPSVRSAIEHEFSDQITQLRQSIESLARAQGDLSKAQQSLSEAETTQVSEINQKIDAAQQSSQQAISDLQKRADVLERSKPQPTGRLSAPLDSTRRR